jgi:hypothetical protein
MGGRTDSMEWGPTADYNLRYFLIRPLSLISSGSPPAIRTRYVKSSLPAPCMSPLRSPFLYLQWSPQAFRFVLHDHDKSKMIAFKSFSINQQSSRNANMRRASVGKDNVATTDGENVSEDNNLVSAMIFCFPLTLDCRKS